MAAHNSYKLQKDGADVTAQQVYDAFISGIVLLDAGSNGVYIPMSIQWHDSNGGQDDPGDVAYVKVMLGDVSIGVGTPRSDK